MTGEGGADRRAGERKKRAFVFISRLPKIRTGIDGAMKKRGGGKGRPGLQRITSMVWSDRTEEAPSAFDRHLSR